MKKHRLLMVVGTIGLFMYSGAAFGGVEPSPFKCRLERVAGGVIYKLETALERGEMPDAVAVQIKTTVRALSQIEDCTRFGPTQRATRRALFIVDDISALMFTPQPEPPGDDLLKQGVEIMNRLSAVMFNPQPEPPGLSAVARTTIGLLSDISKYMFNPQPEPPRWEAVGATFDIMERVMAVGFNPQPEPPGLAIQVVTALKNVARVLFVSQTAADQAMVYEMVDIVDMMTDFRAVSEFR